MQNNVLFWQSPVGYLPEPDREQIDFTDWLENLSIKIKARLFSFFFNPIFNLKNSRANSFSLRTFEMANGKLTNWELIIPLAGKGWNFYLEIVLDESKLIATLVKSKKINYDRPNPPVYRRITASVCSIPFFPHRNLKSNYQ